MPHCGQSRNLPPVSAARKSRQSQAEGAAGSTPFRESHRRSSALPPGFQRIRYYGFLANCHAPPNWISAAGCWQRCAPCCSLSLPIAAIFCGRSPAASSGFVRNVALAR